jgi:hypothetical protein
MNISEIITEKDKLKYELAALQLKQNRLNVKLSELNQLYDDILTNGFLDYIKVGDQHTLTKTFFRVVKDLFAMNVGDVFEIIKKNKKTIIIKYLRKVTLNSDMTIRTETSPNTVHKIDLNRLFNIYNSDPNFKKILIRSINREMKLKELGI